MSLLVTELAKAKINLALHVLGRRQDGYHLLDSIVGFADCGDMLTFAEADQTNLTIAGPFAQGLAADDHNIILKAAAALRQHLQGQGMVVGHTAIRLEKNLPIASGIGGGSADAAATLRGLCRLWNVDVQPDTLARIALALGADVPVCLQQRLCRMQGIGETLSFPELHLPGGIVLVNPLVSQPTKAVFDALGLHPGQNHRTPVDPDHMESWRNDLAEPAVRRLPVIGELLAALRATLAFSYSGMSGSGATCFGLANDVVAAYQCAQELQTQFPGFWVAAGRLG